MMRLARLPLSPTSVGFLAKRTTKVLAATNRRTEAKRLWKMQANAAFVEIRTVLGAMAPGVEHCMYCENSEATDIDHFHPKSRFPRSAFRWTNYLLACKACNSNYKRGEFPKDAAGKALLLDPTREDPRDHIDLSPTTGEYVPRSPKGAESIRVFGLYRKTLVSCRRDAWGSVQAQLIRYASALRDGDTVRALDAQRILCRFPHASIFLAVLDTSKSPAAPKYLDAECLDALQRHPEIRSWIGT